MWEKLLSFLLSTLLPASLFASTATSPLALEESLKIEVEPLAIRYESAVEDPYLDARAALVIETHANEPLYQKNVWEPLPIASLTKLMTAKLAREQLDLELVVTVSPIVRTVGGSTMGLHVGEEITVANLLRGLLINSGNDAAMVLAETVSGSVENFVVLMNDRKQALGLEKTTFVDPSGLGNGNVSSAFDIAHLAKQVFRDPFLQSVMKEKELTVSSHDDRFQHRLVNTNRLLGTPISDRIIAGKTGTTPLAGQCLVSFLESTDDRTTMTILLGSPDRYREIEHLTNWIDESFYWN